MRKLVLFVLSFVFLASLTYGEDVRGDFNGWGTSAMTASLGGTFVFTHQNTNASSSFKFYDGGWWGNATSMAIGTKYTNLNTSSDNCSVSGYVQNDYYAYKWNSDNTCVLFKSTSPFRSITNVARSTATVYPGQSITVTVTINDEFGAGDAAYIRYTTDNWSSSTITEMAGSGTSYSATIPASSNQAGTTVVYYAFTSGSGLTISHSDADLYTINYDNNTEVNYSYTVESAWTTAGDGDWSTGATWAGGNVPASNQYSIVEIGHAVTLDGSINLKSLTVSSGKSFDCGSNTITVVDGGTVTNSGGTFTASSSTFTFEGDGTISGTITFNNVNMNGGLDFGAGSTVGGTMVINSGSYVANNHPPTYGGSSILKYSSGGSYGRSNEWNTTSPVHVEVVNSTTLDLAGTAPDVARTMTGNLTIESGSALSMGSMTESFTIEGNCNIAGALTLSDAAGGDINVGGNFDNDNTFNANSRDIEFNGSSAQDIGGNTATEFAFVTINNSAGVTLSNSASITDRITLTDGLVTLGANNLTLGASATVSGSPDASKMIVATGSGQLRKTYSATGSFTFPVGDNTSTAEYSPVTLNFTSGDFSDAYAAVTLSDSKHGNNSSATDYITRYWTVNQSGISDFSCDVTFTYVDADIEGTETNLHGAAWTGAAWAYLGAVTAASNQISGTVTTFSDFTAGELGAMPVELTNFSVSKSGNNVVLNWNTATEQDNYGFEIERSSDNSVWSNIAFVNGHGNSDSPKEYSFTDNTAGFGMNYYRLKQIDSDGSFEYSNVVEIDNGEMVEDYILAQNYPNPFNPTTRISFGVRENSKASLVVYNAVGQQVAELFNGNAEAGQIYYVEFDGSDLGSGIYFYRLSTPEHTSVRKMILIK